MKKMCIYIHIPFCKKRCYYCSFFSCQNIKYTESYFAALNKEIISRGGDFSGYIVDSVYIGGGTPSFVGAEYIERLLCTVKSHYNLAKDAEITIEANPGTLDGQKAESYISAGVNRFSLGMQSSSDKILKAIGRAHSHKDFVDAVNLLRLSGVKNISCDIMLGLPYQTLDDVKHTVNEILSLDIPHVSAYGLKAEKGTKLYEQAETGQIILPDEDICADMYNYVVTEQKKHNLHRYEISNFAAAGYECRHNINYWRAGQYLGFGAAAHSYINNERYCNVSDIKSYINGQTICEKTVLTKKEREFEYIMLNLRLASGIDLREFKTMFNKDFLSAYSAQLNKFKDFFTVNSRSVSVNDRGFYVINSLLCEFMQ